MKLKKRNFRTGDIDKSEPNREEIARQLYSKETEMCDRLIQEGLAQHRDEARLLLADALDTFTVQREIVRLVKHRIDSDHIGFGYETDSRYKSVNYNE